LASNYFENDFNSCAIERMLDESTLLHSVFGISLGIRHDQQNAKVKIVRGIKENKLFLKNKEFETCYMFYCSLTVLDKT